jgi:hypothetical protein
MVFPPYMPFTKGNSWIVGGAGSYYREGCHRNNCNDYHATDWNMGKDGRYEYDYGQPLYPVAPAEIKAEIEAEGYDVAGQMGYRIIRNVLHSKAINHIVYSCDWTTKISCNSGSHFTISNKEKKYDWFFTGQGHGNVT